MRLLALALVAACTVPSEAPVAMPAAPRESTVDVTFVDTLDGTPATHIAVGGKLRVRVPDAPTETTASGPFAIATAGDTLVITATAAGAGEIELETPFGYARFAVTAAPIESVGILVESSGRGRVALRDASGKRLVDASLRVAPGSAPVAFDRDGWDRIELDTTSPGHVLVKTDLLAATPGVFEHGVATADCPVLAMVNSFRARVSESSPHLAAGAGDAHPRRASRRM
ncbi:MAG: hypothetical protein M4D80_12870 [Myxococcota bacterium]|nr:hypothetical protein [Myxococcota bacterium]